MTKSISPKNIVLYADDDPDDLELVQEAFTRYSKNVDVITAEDGGQALRRLQDLSEIDMVPCLIILDINMPILGGKEVLMHLREHEKFSSVPVVLFTTSNTPIDKQFAKKHNAGFITKPLEIKQMEIITEQFIDSCTEEIQRKIRRELL